MKLPESAAFKLFDKHGIAHPRIDVKTGQVVVKADLALGGKKKAGLVKICTAKDVPAVAKKMGVSVIVEEYIAHDKEYFIALRATREGIEIFSSDKGGVDVEQNWDQVEKKNKSSNNFEKKLLAFFEAEDATYLEINPFTIVQGEPIALGVVLELDEAASFRHSDWSFYFAQDKPGKIAEIDSQIKGSVKLVLTSAPASAEGALTAVMGGGAGAALFLCDAVLKNGLTLANYAEFSGNPPSWALTELTKQVCALPGIKKLVIGSGIANFTDVKANIEAIIDGLKQSPAAKNLNIVVRRCGPGEEEGMETLRRWTQDSGYKIQFFGRETGMTEIVKYV